MNNFRDTVIYTKDISEQQLREFKEQYERIPRNWIQRFQKDNWQIVFTTDISISGADNPNTLIFSDPNDKRVWINIKIAPFTKGVVYIGFIWYIKTEYGNPAENNFFKKVCRDEEKMLSSILVTRISQMSPEAVFELLFIRILEKPQDVRYSYSKACSYVKCWLNEDIFKVRTSILPQYLQIGTDVTEKQVFEIIRAWEKIPIGLRKRFIAGGWKVVLTNSREWRDDEQRKNYAGFLISDRQQIAIKASKENLDMILFHEFGHYMYMLNITSKFIIEFYRAYKKEKNAYYEQTKDNYGISSVEEYFAQVFAYYLKKPEEIGFKVSRSFNIVDAMAKKYK